MEKQKQKPRKNKIKPILKWLILLIPYVVYALRILLTVIDMYCQNYACKIVNYFNLYDTKEPNETEKKQQFS